MQGQKQSRDRVKSKRELVAGEETNIFIYRLGIRINWNQDVFLSYSTEVGSRLFV